MLRIFSTAAASDVPFLTSGKRQMACSHGMLVELHTGVILEEVTRNIKNTYVKCMI